MSAQDVIKLRDELMQEVADVKPWFSYAETLEHEEMAKAIQNRDRDICEDAEIPNDPKKISTLLLGIL